MSFISRSDQVFRRLINKFDLKTDQREPVTVPSVIMPVTDVGVLLQKTKAYRHVEAISSTGIKLLNEVPEGKRWRIMAIQVLKGSGAFTLSALYVYIIADAQTQKIETFASSEDHQTYLDGQEIYLDAGDRIRAYVDAFTTAGNIDCLVYVMEEDLYYE